MFLLIVYVLVALGFSFLCSIAEAVLLSVTSAHIATMQDKEEPAGEILAELKSDINKPLAAILSLNTIAHTVGAAGAGAQAAVVFGNKYLGVASAVLTLLILIFSEIIPKTLGAHYWRELAPTTAYTLKYLTKLFYPFVKLSEWITGGIGHGPTLSGFSRQEFRVMAELSEKEGQLEQEESRIMRNLLRFREIRVKDAMTPRTVVRSLRGTLTVEEFFYKYEQEHFSRIPIYDEDADVITGFVLRGDLLLAQARGNTDKPLKEYQRDIPALLASLSLYQAMGEYRRQGSHMMQVVDEYGSMVGILTLEDMVETLLGLEIVDETDDHVDMQVLARKLWRKRQKHHGE